MFISNQKLKQKQKINLTLKITYLLYKEMQSNWDEKYLTQVGHLSHVKLK